jgi:hypothetical protein
MRAVCSSDGQEVKRKAAIMISFGHRVIAKSCLVHMQSLREVTISMCYRVPKRGETMPLIATWRGARSGFYEPMGIDNDQDEWRAS